MTLNRKCVASLFACAVIATLGSAGARAQDQPPAPPSELQGILYAVEIKTGPAWDPSKKTHEQSHFREHSANLKRLRDQGSLLLGGRYSDKGLLVLQAASEQDAHAMMQRDPSIQNRVFVYELHELNVLYPGSVQSRRRPPAQQVPQ